METKATYKLIEELNGLADGSIEPESEYCGVCNHLIDRGLDETLFCFIATLWPKYSGYLDYPVRNGYEDYQYVATKWDGELGRLRRDLCTFVADWLAERLDD